LSESLDMQNLITNSCIKILYKTTPITEQLTFLFNLIRQLQMTPFICNYWDCTQSELQNYIIRKILWALLKKYSIPWNAVTQPGEYMNVLCRPVGLFHIMLTMDISQRSWYFYRLSYLVQKSVDMLLHVLTAGKLIFPDNHGQIYWGVSWG
jgi:hypothetical protein